MKKYTDKYVLKSRPYPPHDMWDGYYTGDKYMFQSECYAVADCDIEKAKIYTSLARATNACNALNNSVCNYQFDVKSFIEIKDGKKIDK